MATLQGQKLKDTYVELLKLDSPTRNTGVTSTLKAVEDGSGTGTALSLSTNQITSNVDGSAATPAISRTSDTNTGIFFPASDTIAATTNGAERLRIDSIGYVGIGTTSPTVRLHVVGSARVGTGNDYQFDSTLKINGESTGATGYLRFYTNSLERLRIDSSGNVGIGTTSPATKLDVSGNIQGNEIFLANGASSSPALGTTPSWYSPASGVAALSTNATERLRITSGGEVYIAGETDQGAYNLQVNGTGVWGAGAYVNGSDERLKENIQDITSGLDVVGKLRPVSFQYKENYTADRSVQSGFIAQDLLVALEGKNYLEGVVSQGPTYYNVAYQNLIPILAKAIQELKAENDSLKSRIEALEAA